MWYEKAKSKNQEAPFNAKLKKEIGFYVPMRYNIVPESAVQNLQVKAFEYNFDTFWINSESYYAIKLTVK